MNSPPSAQHIAHHHHPSGPLAAVQSVLYLIVIAIFIIAFSAQPFQIPSGSMEPTLLVGDFLLVNKQLVPTEAHDPLPPTSIHRGDIVVFHYPVEPSLHLVKRVIGLPGDRVRLREGHVYINDQRLDEPYAVYRAAGPDSFRDNFPRMETAEPGIDANWWIEMRHRIDHDNLVVPPNKYFVLGDNRNNSEDSRYWGFVPRSAIVGKPFLIYFSLRRIERNDPSAAPQLKAPLRSSRIRQSFLGHLVDLARWDRTLRVIY
ncbi:signal peptidase I [Granulicella arctica]|uniref:signal peptidase I n=1 Tax=Granulicella arctica TaxID=940613 RepID=UPI0021DF6656|nr:signal peptidase I [Granulicella arctica]